MTFEVSDLDEVVRWSLGFGADATVMAPAVAVARARDILLDLGVWLARCVGSCLARTRENVWRWCSYAAFDVPVNLFTRRKGKEPHKEFFSANLVDDPKRDALHSKCDRAAALQFTVLWRAGEGIGKDPLHQGFELLFNTGDA